MRKFHFFIAIVFFVTNIYAQKTEFGFSLNSGLYSFAGKSAETVTVINYYDKTNHGYTNNPYGSKNGLSYGFSLNLKRITQRNFIFGLDLGYEISGSKISITGIRTSTYEYEATGKTILQSNFINIYPMAGYKLNFNYISFNVICGFDFGYCLSTDEKGTATATNGMKYTTSEDRKTIEVDIRPRIQISTEYKRIGLYIGYSNGITNYMSGYDGGTNITFAKIVRFGVSYKISHSTIEYK